jgi:hypothetical protein
MLTRFADEHTGISEVFMDDIVTMQVCQRTQNSSRIMSQEIYIYRQVFRKVEGQINTTYKFLKLKQFTNKTTLPRYEIWIEYTHTCTYNQQAYLYYKNDYSFFFLYILHTNILNQIIMIQFLKIIQFLLNTIDL